MHVIFRETHGIEETVVPQDLGQAPADLVVLSFSDSDLGAFAAGWHGPNRPQTEPSPLIPNEVEGQAPNPAHPERSRGTRRCLGFDQAAIESSAPGLPSLRLANLAALAHPLSVDTYIDRTLSGAKAILIRLIGGVSYWSYGLQQVEIMARQHGIALAVLPADGRPDARLDAVSTVPAPLLRELARLCDTGGAVAAQAALALLAQAAGFPAAPIQRAHELPTVGGWRSATGTCCPATFAMAPDRPRILLVFYRSYLTAADLEPFTALESAFAALGFDFVSLFAPSLKAPDVRGWLARRVALLQPAAIINATAFSARGEDGQTPLDAAGVPVFQIALATSSRTAWRPSTRGLSPADLAMHIVLPEVDGRIFAGVASFKDAAAHDPALEFARGLHRADPARVTAIAARIAGWVRLAQTPASDRKLAFILSTYPGKAHQMAHAVGLDALASAQAILSDLASAGYAIGPCCGIADQLQSKRLSWPLADYRKAMQSLPETLQTDLASAWGDPEADPAIDNGMIEFAAIQAGAVTLALQPERGAPTTRADDDHDLSRVPRHA